MADRVGELLPELQAHRLPGFPLSGDFIYPNYLGRSILNIPSTICSLLGVEGLGAGPLDETIISPSRVGPVRRVILVVMDGLALHRFQKWTANGPANVWQRLVEDGQLAPLTSITPSTTSAALPTLWTGRSAAEHGITGYEMWMKEYGVVANTITHSPFTTAEPGSLQRAGFDPDTYLPFPTLGTHLKTFGISSFAFQHYSILRSGLSRMFLRDVQLQAYSTATDLWINLRRALESHPDRPSYNYVYWSEVDSFSHRYGPDDERSAGEFASFSSAMQHFFLEGLSPAIRQGTLLMLVADHGHITTRIDPFYELRNHPNLTRRLHIFPTGENRLAYFYVKPGQREAVREYLERNWPNQFIIIDSGYAVEGGLFGPGKPHPYLLDRVGDFILVARHDAYLWWAAKDNPLIGRHGGLHADEMLVPFLAVRL